MNAHMSATATATIRATVAVKPPRIPEVLRRMALRMGRYPKATIRNRSPLSRLKSSVAPQAADQTIRDDANDKRGTKVVLTFLNDSAEIQTEMLHQCIMLQLTSFGPL